MIYRRGKWIAKCPFCDVLHDGDTDPKMRQRDKTGRVINHLSGDPIEWQCDACKAWIAPEDEE